MPQLTPAQQKTIQAWADKRDAILREIGIYTTQLDELQKSTKAEGLALADIQRSIAEARGRIAELEALETRYRGSLATDIAELEIRKSRLQGECDVMEEKLAGGAKQYEIVTVAISALDAAHDKMKDQARIVNTVVGEIIQTSQLHTSDMKVIMAEIKAIADEVIDKGNQNVAHASELLQTVPKFIARIQKHSVERMYPEGHPRYVKPN